MHSTPNTKHRVAYFCKHYQTQQDHKVNPKEKMTVKLVLGEETLGLYAHSNQGNLDYLASQI